jgi:hypothetical protein
VNRFDLALERHLAATTARAFDLGLRERTRLRELDATTHRRVPR